MSAVREKTKCRLLKLAAMLAVTAGIIMAFYSFYIMSELYSLSMSDSGKAMYTAIKLLNIAFLAVIAEGVFFVIAGFYGMINIGDEDASKKIKLYGIIMCVAGLVDLAIVFAVSHYDITGRTLLLICLPAIIGALYLGGAFLNVSQIRAKKGEDND